MEILKFVILSEAKNLKAREILRPYRPQDDTERIL